MEKKLLEFQDYEIENILRALELAIIEERRNCKWELQPNGHHYYTDNKKIKQLRFTIKSIKRQIAKMPLDNPEETC